MSPHDRYDPSGSLDIDNIALSAYLAGESSPEEQARVEQWLDADPGNGAVLDAVRQAWHVAARPLVAGDVDRFLERLEPRLAAPARTPGARGGWTLRWGATAVRTRVNVLSVLCGVLVLLGIVSRFSQSPIRHTTRLYVTTSGERATVRLADGSRAILAPATTLSVTTSRAGVDAMVVGEASFTVVGHSSVPFTVHAGRAMVSVLGTTFDVRHYATDRVARVVVTNGRVAVRDGARDRRVAPRVVLGARTLGVVDDSGAVRVIPDIVSEDEIAWTTGRLVFRETPVTEILAELGRAYAVDIRLTDSALGRNTLTFTVPVAKRSLNDVLDALAATLGAHVLRSDSVIRLVPGVRTPTQHSISRPTFILESQHGK